MLNRSQIKCQAKEINRAARVSAYLFALLYFAIAVPLKGIDAYASGSICETLRQLVPWVEVPQFLIHREFPDMLVLFVSIMVTLLVLVLDAGFKLYILGVRDGREMGFDTLFEGFSFAGKLVWLYLNIWVRIVLRGMLLVIPGVIAFYRYRFAVFNLCENPEMSVAEALDRSRTLTFGHKLDLFVMDLSFIGWFLLSALTLYVLMIWLTPYYLQTEAGFYREICREKDMGRPGNASDDGRESFDPGP